MTSASFDVWNDPQLGVRLRDAIADSRGNQARSSMSPALAYGRHRGPARDTSRSAAVVIALFQDAAGQWMIPLTMRPRSLQHHGGQICLPGGRVESNETASEAALREYEEELGLTPNPVLHCGELSPLYVFASDNLVRPIVVTIEPPKSDWCPDPVEVAEVILLPLKTLLTSPRGERVRTRQVCQEGSPVGELTYRAPLIQCVEHEIWGATAMILDELAQLLH